MNAVSSSEPTEATGRGARREVPMAASPPASDAEPLSVSVMADIAAGLAEARTLWQSLVRYEPDGRDPVRLLATERYEAWVIGWLPGQGVRPHDHGDAAGTFVVTSGELTEVLPRLCGAPVERRLVPGRTRHVPVGRIHDVVNHSLEPATSIHVYSPPLTHMTYYDGMTRRPVETVAVEAEQPVLGPRAPSFPLHPANRG